MHYLPLLRGSAVWPNATRPRRGVLAPGSCTGWRHWRILVGGRHWTPRGAGIAPRVFGWWCGSSREPIIVNTQVVQVAWYRFHATFARRVGGYVALVVLVGLLGGVAMASVAAARSTQSSFPSFYGRYEPVRPGRGRFAGRDGRRWGVDRSHPCRFGACEAGRELGCSQQPHGAAGRNSHGREFGRSSRRRVRRGEPERIVHETGPRDGGAWPNARSDTSRRGGQRARRRPSALGLHVGDVSRQGFYTGAQSNSPAYGTAQIRPVFIQAIKVVGIVKFNNEVVQDDIDRGTTFVLLSPALARRLAQCCGWRECVRRTTTRKRRTGCRRSRE